MARIRAFGAEFAADLIKNLGDGLWVAKARAHTARTVPGTTIIVKQSEILEAAAAEMPGTSDSPSAPASPSLSAGSSIGLAEVKRFLESQADLEAAMEEERKTLPSPADLLAQHRANLPPSPDKTDLPAVSVPPNPTTRP